VRRARPDLIRFAGATAMELTTYAKVLLVSEEIVKEVHVTLTREPDDKVTLACSDFVVTLDASPLRKVLADT
jgi:hypothetical protein